MTERRAHLRTLSVLLCIWALIGATLPAFAEDAKIPEEQAPQSSRMLKGGVRYCVPSGTSIKLKMATVPSNGMHMLERDLDGRLLPAKLGEEITAKTSEDLYVDDNKVIPEGTVFYGVVSKIDPPRRVGRPGSLSISFSHFTTPDGRAFAFKVEADNKKESTAKTKAKGFGILAANAAGGAIVGTLVAYQLFGLHYTIACKGYNLAAGAAGGALLATGVAIMRKGPKATLEPGDDLNMQIDSDLLMPAAVDPKTKTTFANLKGVEVDIKRAKLIRDSLQGHFLKVDCSILNNSESALNSIDLFVEDSNGNRYPVTAGDDDDSDFIFTVDPHTSVNATLQFQVEFPKLKRKLVWLNHDNRQVCFRQQLP